MYPNSITKVPSPVVQDRPERGKFSFPQSRSIADTGARRACARAPKIIQRSRSPRPWRDRPRAASRRRAAPSAAARPHPRRGRSAAAASAAPNRTGASKQASKQAPARLKPAKGGSPITSDGRKMRYNQFTIPRRYARIAYVVSKRANSHDARVGPPGRGRQP